MSCFIKNFALIAKPLSDLMKKGVEFKMGDEHLISFKQLKTALIQTPVFGLFNPTATTEIHTDALMYGYGAILLQKTPKINSFTQFNS